MEMYEAYREKMNTQLKEWNSQINLLEAKIANLSADARVKRIKEVQVLRAKLHVVSYKMETLGKDSGESWEEVKLATDKLWNDLKSGLANAQSKFL